MTGLEATLAALAARRACLLLVSNAYRAAGARCPDCGMLTAAPGPCSRCGGSTRTINDVVIEAVGEALSAGCDVRIVAEDERMKPALHGVACVLRR